MCVLQQQKHLRVTQINAVSQMQSKWLLVMHTFHKNSHDHTDTVTIGNAIMSVIIAVNWTIVCISEKKQQQLLTR